MITGCVAWPDWSSHLERRETIRLSQHRSSVCLHLDYRQRHHPPLTTNTGDVNSDCLSQQNYLDHHLNIYFGLDSLNKTFNELFTSHKKRAVTKSNV